MHSMHNVRLIIFSEIGIDLWAYAVRLFVPAQDKELGQRLAGAGYLPGVSQETQPYGNYLNAQTISVALSFFEE